MVYTKEPIAIVGSACRLPGSSSSPAKLWDLLRAPHDVLSEFPNDRLNLSSFHNMNGEHHGSTDVKNKSYILSEDPRLFDAAFFNINPREADGMDPQQRILLETCYEALESAGCTMEQIQGSLTSVFVGSMTNDYYDIQMRDSETMPTYAVTGTARSFLSNRISYFFDLKGESMTIDTACSSSLVALHQAVQSLRSSQSQYSIVAGANIILDPVMYIGESKLHMLSSDARSRMWDVSANGYARGEGVTALFLKTLSQALKDGDHIECLVRETSVNSDGRTKGITMPSATTQADLIRRTYYNAGLDPLVDRCHYFECHGTGTPAGDPQEAQAIQEAFFPARGTEQFSNEKLFVGSIKTVVGHTEGCAGLAGVIKASLAIQHQAIPPNMHFKELNPAIAPYCDHLQVATDITPWPQLLGDTPRVSVNSFGLGGTNAHAIIEGYEAELVNFCSSTPSKKPDPEERFVGPLTFSAKTRISLVAIIKAFITYIELHPSADLKALTYVLQRKRTSYPIKASFSGANRQQLLSSMETHVEAAGTDSENATPLTYMNLSNESLGKLGIFTGQGAQWASMSRNLIVGCRVFRESIEGCERSLACVPKPPSWSLKKELMAGKETSRLSEAAISQPLCTAVQIAMIDLLSAAGIKLDAVVGHSSGEIAATYAAGIISARDAIRIAYYRGYYASLAHGTNGVSGAMIAVGLPLKNALSFCAKPSFSGRISVAACNAPAIVTLAGDADAINEAKEILDEQKISAKLLHVSTAYHSHHMLACAGPYLDSLRACDIKVSAPRDNCTWISSVQGDVDILNENLDSLAGQYWVDNMVKPVLFSQAIECSLWNGGPFDLVVELGPHPALKGPALQTIKSATATSLPYIGLMAREKDEVEAFSDAVGYVWSSVGGSSVDLDGYGKAFEEPNAPEPKMLKDLPSYAWDHRKVHWIESRLSRRYRLSDEPYQELLGRKLPDDSATEMRWRNILRLNELPWLRGHEFQGQVLFPAAGYIAMALEASKRIANQRALKLIELRDYSIFQALVLDDNSLGVEIVFAIRINHYSVQASGTAVVQAEFDCYACSDALTGSLVKKCAGRLFIHLGQASMNELPLRVCGPSNVLPVDMERFTSSLVQMGLNYQGLFRGMKSANRTIGHATASALWSEADLGKAYMLHPAFLDTAFQSLFAALSSPASEGLLDAYLPIGIQRIVVNPNMSYRCPSGVIKLNMDAFVTESSFNLLKGDVHLFDFDGNHGVQVEGLTMKSISEPRATDDRLVFAENVWEADVSYGLSGLEQPQELDDSDLVDAIERTALHYLRIALDDIAQREVSEHRGYHQRMFEAFHFFLDSIKKSKIPAVKTEWLDDSRELILEMKNRYAGQAELEVMHAIGENLVSVLHGNAHLFDVTLENDVLDRLYTEGYGFAYLNRYIARVVKRITFKYPDAKILGIGTGSGGTAESILDVIDNTYSSYTFSDVSSEYFEKASKKFANHRSKLTFWSLDIEKDIIDPGRERNSYDIVIAWNALHATRDLSLTLKHTRNLLKPGGYLILMEMTGNTLRMPLLMSGLPGWWVGAGEGRQLNLGISPVMWDDLLRANDFSGVDSIVHDMPDRLRHSCSVIVTQAMDDKFNQIRDPLSFIDSIPFNDRLMIIGGRTLPIAKLIRDTAKLLSSRKNRLTIVQSIDDLNEGHLASRTSMICLTELDRPLFSDPMNATRLEKVQTLFSQGSNVLWLTTGRLHEDPTANMTVGIGRALMAELPQLNLQFVDASKISILSSRFIVETFLRLMLSMSPQYRNHNMLWTTEPEGILNGEAFLIPRIITDHKRNERLNSTRRAIVHDVDSDELPVQLCLLRGLLALEVKSSFDYHSTPGYTRINTAYSIALPSKEQDPHCLCVGTVQGTAKVVLAISSSHASSIDVPTEEVFHLDPNADYGPEMLKAVTSQLVIDSILPNIPVRGSVVFYELEETLAEAVTHDRRWQGREVFFVSSKQVSLPGKWIWLHPQTSERAVKSALPSDIGCVVDFSITEGHNAKACLLMSNNALCHFNSSVLDPNRHKALANAYGAVLARSYPSLRQSDPGHGIQVQALVGAPLPSSLHPTVVDWTQSNRMTVAVKPLEPSRLFSPTKSYFMVGLTGELGRSLCRWMVNSGARYIALASRNPELNGLWLNEMRKSGATVKVYKMDVTQMESVRAVHAAVSGTMPPIAGVCNAAMVLSDKLFVDMSIENMDQVLKPKVDGTRHLDEVFCQPSLDFFILFSSLASVIGNGGQSNYHAANLFMTSLANQRRAKGLAASVMSIGMVADIGYVQRTGRTIEDHLRKLFYVPISESDVHHLFAEAIQASPPTAKYTSEIIMGIRPFTDSVKADAKPPWYTNPRFSHFVVGANGLEEQQPKASASLQIREQLEGASSEESAMAIIQGSFCRKLGLILQLTSSAVDVNISLLELGCDSLLAVEIRTWFLKEVHVDIPIIRILGGATPAEISRDAAKKHLASGPTKSQDNPLVKVGIENLVEIVEEVPSGASDSAQAAEIESSQASDIDSDLKTSDAQSQSLGYENFERVEKMSYAQSRMWFLDSYMKDPAAYNVTISYEITGQLQRPRFQRALATVVSHHKSLQTCFFSEPGGGELMQGVMRSEKEYFKHIQTSDKGEIKNQYDAMKNHVWNLEQGQTFGATLITQDPYLHTIIFGYHHIIMDGLSWHLFLRDLHLAYRMMPLEPVTKEYMDFTSDQLRLIEGGNLQAQIAFWENELLGMPDHLPLLPFARVKSRMADESYDRHIVSTVISEGLAIKIKKACQALRATPFHFHLTVIQILLSKLLNVGDICIGVTDANRGDDDLANTIGFFLNLLPLRFQVDHGDQFSKMVKQTSDKVFSALANSKVPFDLLLDRLSVPRSASHSPLFQVALNYRMGDVLQTELGDCHLNMTSYVDAKSQYDVAFGVTQTSAGTSLLEITSAEHLYTYESTKLLMDMYVYLLDSLSAETSLRVHEISLWSPTKAEQAIDIGRGPRTNNDLPGTLSERFDIIERKCPDDIAIKDSLDAFSYSQLAKRVNTIATALLDRGSIPGSRIAVLCQPSIGTIACMLAILRIGCIYVPLDLSLPEARHAAILATCEPILILYQSAELESASKLASVKTTVMDISELPNGGVKQVEAMAHPDSPAFLLFTSGSTGVPKGILLSQAGFTNFLASKASMLSRQDKEVVLQQSSYGFDMSITQTFYALAFGRGGTLVVVPQSARGDPVELSKLMLKENVTLTIATPSEYLMILRYGREFLNGYSSWRHACTGGEAVKEQLKREFGLLGQSQLVLTDFYGPTEISAATSMETLSLTSTGNVGNDDYTSVGRPIANSSIYIVDEECRSVPVGFPGEICVGGVGVAVGYLDLPDLNRTKFLLDPFATPDDIAKGWTKMFKTGDRGRIREDGSLSFMGRKGNDTQIKLRGLRIELDDVANTLLQNARGLLVDAIATVRGDPEFLVAHVVLAPGECLSDEELQHLGHNLPLPQYMCPAMTISLDHLPTNHNGKIDRKALESMPLPLRESPARAQNPLTIPQGQLKLVWQAILPQMASVIDLDPDSDFFLVGGNSLLLVKLQGAIKEKMRVSVPLRDLYKASTLGRMAAQIAAEKTDQQRQEEISIAWESETAVPAAVYISTRQAQSRSCTKHNDREVLLTGSTSFLGSAILTSLLQDDSIGKVHCLAIPAEGQRLLPNSEKIALYPGSLLDPNLGLSRAQYAKVQSCIDLIIHAGANGHCLNNYFSLKIPNFDSTRFLVTLALPRQIPLHFVSSNRVTLLSGSTAMPPISVAEYPPAKDGSEGFTASKWASERFLENISRETGLQVCLHRPCAVIGEKAPSEDALNALIKYSILMRAVPRFESFVGYFDFKDVHSVASEIVTEVTTIKRDGSDDHTAVESEPPSLRIRHYSSGKQVPVYDFKHHMEEIHGCSFEELSMGKWLSRAVALGIENLIVSYLEAIVERGDKISFPYLGSSS